MRRVDFEHLVAAAANIADEDDFVVIGSQALLGSRPDADGELVVSMELDLYPMKAPDKADLIDGALGDGSRFQQTYGYYAHGVGPETALAGRLEGATRAGSRSSAPRVDPFPSRPLPRAARPGAVEVRSRSRAGLGLCGGTLSRGFVLLETLLERVSDLPVAADQCIRTTRSLTSISDRLAAGS